MVDIYQIYQNIDCNINRFINYATWSKSESINTISNSIHKEYIETNYYPCLSVQVLCNQSLCNMEYLWNIQKILSLQTELNGTGDCHWININKYRI